MTKQTETADALADLYERNDKIEKELNRLNHNLKTADDPRKEQLLQELQEVINEIERIEDSR